MITHSRIEARIFPAVRRGLRQQVAPVIEAIRERGPEYAESQLNRLVTIDPIYRAFNDFYPSMLIFVAKGQYRELRREKDIIPQWIVDAWNSFAATYLLTDIFSRMASITETTRRRIERVIRDEIEVQAIIDRLAARDFVDPHAFVIARTEATTILNVGRQQGAMAHGRENEVRMWHGWVPVEDEATRPAHFAMREVRPIPLAQRFEVGGELLRYPGDPEGSSGNTINCRCGQVFFTETEIVNRYGRQYVDSFNAVLV